MAEQQQGLLGRLTVVIPTHRKVRDGWGTRAVVLGGREEKTEADPLRDDNKKDNRKGEGNGSCDWVYKDSVLRE